MQEEEEENTVKQNRYLLQSLTLYIVKESRSVDGLESRSV